MQNVTQNRTQWLLNGSSDESSDLLGPRAPRPLSLNARERDLNETCDLDLMATDAGGAPAVPANHLSGNSNS